MISRATVIGAFQAALDQATNTLPADPVIVPPPPALDHPAIVIYGGSRGLTSDGPWGPSGVAGAPGADPTFLTWKNAGGDWLDADGVPQGAKAFATRALAVGQTGAITLDVTSFVLPGIEAQMALRGLGSAYVQVQAKESGFPARLIVDYQDGTRDTIPVMYDVGDDPSTVYSTEGRPSYVVGLRYIGYLRFAASASKPIRAATLELTILKVWTAGTIGVFRFARHPEVDDPYYLDIVNPFLRTEAFEPGTIPEYLRHMYYDKDQYKQLSVVAHPNGGKAQLRRWSTQSEGCTNANILFPDANGRWGAEVDHVAFRYKLRILADFLPSLREGGKLAFGLSGPTHADDTAYQQAYNIYPGSCGTPPVGGGAQSNGKNGCTLRGLFHPGFDPEHPLHGRLAVGTYAYWARMKGWDNPKGANGENWEWVRALTGTFEPDRDYEITIEARASNPGQYDGLHRVWVDRKLWFVRNDVMHRDVGPYMLESEGVVTRLAFRSIYDNSYHGGHQFPQGSGGHMVSAFEAMVLA